MLGDSVNLASRLEGLTAAYGLTILLCSETAKCCASKLAMIEVDTVRVKGKQQAETVYTLLGGPELLRQDNFRALRGAFVDMRECYGRSDWGAARSALARCRRLNDFAQMTGVLDLYEARLAVLEADPPAANWEGVFSASAPAHRAIA